MRGLGTVVNMVAIVTGAAIGLSVRGGLGQRFQETIMKAMGLAVLFIGISGTLQGMLRVNGNRIESVNVMLMIISLALGAFFGEVINIEARLEQLGERIKRAMKISEDRNQSFVEGFVTSSLLFCIGAMAIIGALQDGLTGDASMLFAKSLIDGITAIFFASTLGTGVFFSAIPVGLYQGMITGSAAFVGPYLSDRLITNISFIGSILIFGIGINMLFGKKMKCGNLLPAVFIPIVYEVIQNLIK